MYCDGEGNMYGGSSRDPQELKERLRERREEEAEIYDRFAKWESDLNKTPWWVYVLGTGIGTVFAALIIVAFLVWVFS